MTGGRQSDELVAFEREGCELESSHRRCLSPLGKLLLTSASFVKMIHTVVSLSKEEYSSNPKTKKQPVRGVWMQITLMKFGSFALQSAYTTP